MSFKVGDVVYLKPQYKSKKKLKDRINSLGHKHVNLDDFNNEYYDICDLKEIRIESLYTCSAYKTNKKSITNSVLNHYYPQEIFTKYNIEERINKLLKL